ncbi:MAG: ribbon-helix-helix protein, CopG family [Acidimicrobiia bacterium]|nr:ribbon-helix-helix protein, CopG family [Acidimicrobiia bacterium]
MKRTTIMAEETTVERLKDLARTRGVSFAEVVREALAEKAGSYRPQPTSIGSGESSPSGTARHEATKRQPPRSWR